MFQIIKTGQTKSPELHYVDFTSKSSTSPPPLIHLRSSSYTGSSTKRQFVKVNEEMFVNEIKKRPILYNTTMKDYKRFSTRHEAWAEVAVAMNLSEQECKKRWRSLRDAFMKVVRNKSEEEQKTWIHYRLLEFLLPYMGTKSKKSRTVEFIEGFEPDDDTEYVEFAEEIGVYEGSRDPITVSYVTEDGKEVFQMLQDPDTIPEGAVIGIEETEDEEEAEEEEHEIIESIEHPVQLEDQESIPAQEDHTVNYLYEERLDASVIDFREPYESVDQQSFSETTIKQETILEEADSESPVEETEMETDDHEEDRSCLQSETQFLIEENIQRSEQSTSTENLIESQAIHSSVPIQEISAPPTPASLPCQTPATSIASQPSQEELTVRESENKFGDSDERFLLSCAPILRRLPNKKNQLARLKIQQLLFELEYDEKYSS